MITSIVSRKLYDCDHQPRVGASIPRRAIRAQNLTIMTDIGRLTGAGEEKCLLAAEQHNWYRSKTAGDIKCAGQRSPKGFAS